MLVKVNARRVSEDDVGEMMRFVVMLKEDDTFIAWSPVLDESSEGDTPEEAAANLRRAVRLRLKDPNMPAPKRVKVQGFFLRSVFVQPVMGQVKLDGKNQATLRP